MHGVASLLEALRVSASAPPSPAQLLSRWQHPLAHILVLRALVAFCASQDPAQPRPAHHPDLDKTARQLDADDVKALVTFGNPSSQALSRPYYPWACVDLVERLCLLAHRHAEHYALVRQLLEPPMHQCPGVLALSLLSVEPRGTGLQVEVLTVCLIRLLITAFTSGEQSVEATPPAPLVSVFRCAVAREPDAVSTALTDCFQRRTSLAPRLLRLMLAALDELPTVSSSARTGAAAAQSGRRASTKQQRGGNDASNSQTSAVTDLEPLAAFLLGIRTTRHLAMAAALSSRAPALVLEQYLQHVHPHIALLHAFLHTLSSGATLPPHAALAILAYLQKHNASLDAGQRTELTALLRRHAQGGALPGVADLLPPEEQAAVAAAVAAAQSPGRAGDRRAVEQSPRSRRSRSGSRAGASTPAASSPDADASPLAELAALSPRSPGDGPSVSQAMHTSGGGSSGNGKSAGGFFGGTRQTSSDDSGASGSGGGQGAGGSPFAGGGGAGGAGGAGPPGGGPPGGEDHSSTDPSHKHFPPDIEDEANRHFQRIYTGQITIDEAIQLLLHFKNSASHRERDVYGCMLNNLFDEYRFFSKYPDKELDMTGVLFGSLIQHQLVSYIPLGIALRYVLEALRMQHAKMFRFGLLALQQFKSRLHEWPQYCSHLLQIPHIVHRHPDIVEFIQNQVSLSQLSGAMDSREAHVSQPSSGAGAASSSSSATGASAASLVVGASGTVTSTSGAPMMTAAQVASEMGLLEDAAVPAEAVKDKVHFVLNNVSLENLNSKADELRRSLPPTAFGWLAQYLVLRRVSLEANLHDLYETLLTRLNRKRLSELVLLASYRFCRLLIDSRVLTTDRGERSMAKTMGTWLGRLTLARNRPVLHQFLPFKNMLLDAYTRGRLVGVVPFVACVLSALNASRFTTKNAWVNAVLSLLAEIYQSTPNLKMNLKLEISLLFETLGLNVDEATPSTLLLRRNLSAPSGANPDLRNLPPGAEGASVASRSDAAEQAAAVDAAAVSQQFAMPQTAPYRVGPSSLVDSGAASVSSAAADRGDAANAATSTLAGASQVNPDAAAANAEDALQLLEQFPELRLVAAGAVERAVHEVLGPVVERSVTIACMTARELVQKDLACEGNPNLLRRAAHLMVQGLAGSLTLATCKELLRNAILTNMRQRVLAALAPHQSAATSAVQLQVLARRAEALVQRLCDEHLDAACQQVEKAASEQAVQYTDDAMAPAVQLRIKHQQVSGGPFYQAPYYPSFLPAPLRPNPKGLTAADMQVYNDFAAVHAGMASSVSAAPQQPAAAPVSIENTLDVPSPVTAGGDVISGQQVLEHFYTAMREVDALALQGAPAASAAPQTARVCQLVMGAQRAAENAHLFASKLLARLLHLPPNSPYLLFYLRLLRRLCELPPARQTLSSQLLGWVMSSAQPVSPSLLTAMLQLGGLLNVGELDHAFSTTVQRSPEFAANQDSHSMNLLSLVAHTLHHVVFELRTLPASAFPRTFDAFAALARIAAPAEVLECTQVLLDDLRALAPAATQPAQPVAAVKDAPTQQPPAAVAASPAQPPLELEHDEGPAASAAHALLDVWMRMHRADAPSIPTATDLHAFLQRITAQANLFHEAASAAAAAAKKAQSERLSSSAVSESSVVDDLLPARFVRLCVRRAVIGVAAHRRAQEQEAQQRESTGGGDAAGKDDATRLSAEVYREVDAVSRLITLLVRRYTSVYRGTGGAQLSGSGPTSSDQERAQATAAAVGIVVEELQHHYGVYAQARRGFSLQRPYFRLLLGLLCDLSRSESTGPDVHSQRVLLVFSTALVHLSPQRFPGFAFAWLELVSHRQFMPKLLLHGGHLLFQRLLVSLLFFLQPHLRTAELSAAIRLLYRGALRVLLVLLHDFPEFLCDHHFSLCDALPPTCIQMRNLVLSAFPRNMRLPDPFTPNLKVDLLPEIKQSPQLRDSYASALERAGLTAEVDTYLKTRLPVSFLQKLPACLAASASSGSDGSIPSSGRYNVPLINSLVVYVGVHAIQQLQVPPAGPSGGSGGAQQPSIAHTPPMDVYQQLVLKLDAEGRYLFLNAIANQLRYPNNHTHYFSCVLLYLFADAGNQPQPLGDLIKEQITRVLLERLIANRPYPWGLAITFIELIKNPHYKFWSHSFTRCTPEIERLFESVSNICKLQTPKQQQQQQQLRWKHLFDSPDRPDLT
mmetsp:Transcript_12253/g.31061  ORF Transcript_12253/g.31061 Transcript_12253/m.31061 type:complete len:2192 (-) Transcript_12253:27-6602(-)